MIYDELREERLAALNKCLKLWRSMLKTGKSKEQTYVDLKLTLDTNSCPACEFDLVHGHYCYSECIVDWGNGSSCESKGSPYRDYMYCNGPVRDAIKRIIDRLIISRKKVYKTTNIPF